ncbi:hypothetical protein D9Q98_004551 [Chlorella vulgaris]|uniref:Peptidase M43 pregnancy-associated plasma-A domain-containing protein n=1 Tax=Chlorella vulgaris TaxID=3077 RepID=A0A9D4TQ28_CHLVU|nr:hypothetical protein D9Q98_004551 [Chlorella vulgaris]
MAFEDEAGRLRQRGEEDSADANTLPVHIAGSRSPSTTSGSRPWTAWSSRPSVLLATGLALLAVGAALVVTPLALQPGSSPAATPAASSGLNDEGVPLDALASAQDEAGDLLECSVTLPDRDAYLAAAVAAEASLLGAPAGELPPEQLQQEVAQLPSLLFGTVFWVLVSDSHPWSPEFDAAAASQVATLNAAFQGLGVSFRLDALVSVPATDAVVLQCGTAERWEQLALQLLPPAAAQNDSSSSGSTAAAAAAAAVGNPVAVHVILCEPGGVMGASHVLGSNATAAATAAAAPTADAAAAGATSNPAPGAASGTVLLRRSALWQSRSGLVHQLGHFFGLPHPFPDGRQTCRLDGDGIRDTPQTFAPNHGCEQEGDMHVCPDSEDGVLPALNFMDFTNDTCRRTFTSGQQARMQAMLRAYRPRLFAAAASTGPRPQQALALDSAWQSGVRADGSVQAQEGQQLMLDSWQQAALAADGQLAADLPSCSCLGADAEARVFWVGRLNASYPVAAVRLLLPIQLENDDNVTAGAAAVGGSPGTRGDDAAEVTAVALAPSVDGTTPALAPAAATPKLAAAGQAGRLDLEVRVGDSLRHSDNQLCGLGSSGPGLSMPSLQQPQQQMSPLQEVQCTAPVSGRYVSVEVLAPGGGPAAAVAPAAQLPAGEQQQQQVCLCEVQPLAATAPARSVPPHGRTDTGTTDNSDTDSASWQPLPAVQLDTADMEARQSTGSRPSQALAGLGLLPGQGSVQCSSTGTEADPWWSLGSGLDAVWVRGLRLALPSPTCQGNSGGGSSGSGSTSSSAGAYRCQPPTAVNLTIYVGEQPPEQFLGGSLAPAGTAVCAASVAVLPGRLVEIPCAAGYLQGRHVTVMAAAQLQPAPLALCGVELLGALDLPPSQHMTQQLPLAASSKQLQPYFALPVDGDSGSCLQAPASAVGADTSSSSSSSNSGSSSASSSLGTAKPSWQLQLDGSYPLLAVQLLATPQTNGSLVVSLLDGGGGLVAVLTASGGAAPAVLELPAPVHAASVQVEGFAQLCEVQLLSAAPQPALSYPLRPSMLGGSSSGGTGGGSSSHSAPSWRVVVAGEGGAASGGTSLFDSNPRSCLTAPQLVGVAGLGSTVVATALEVLLDRPYLIKVVELLVGGSQPLNVTVAAAAPGAANSSSFVAAWASAVACQLPETLYPWQPARLQCSGPLLTDRLLVQLVPAADPVSELGGMAAAALAVPPAKATGLALCELVLCGLPAAN